MMNKKYIDYFILNKRKYITKKKLFKKKTRFF